MNHVRHTSSPFDAAGSPLPVRAGIGLRSKHHGEIITRKPDIGFLEIHPENYFGGGMHVDLLTDYARHYPISFHGVGLSLGSMEPLDPRHINALKALAERIKPAVISDHVSWSASGNAHLGDLLPLPYTQETLNVVAGHIMDVQEALGRSILVENPSTYLAFTHSTMSEPEFLARLVEHTGCGLLLDINNIYVQCHNNGGTPQVYFDAVDPASVGEIHLAGHTESDYGETTLLIDTHDDVVRDEVWALYADALEVFGPTPTLIEWDRDLPELDVFLGEAAKAEEIMLGREGNRATG